MCPPELNFYPDPLSPKIRDQVWKNPSTISYLDLNHGNFAFRIARRYAAGCAGRKKIVNVFESEEPIGFTGFFQAWQKDYDPNAKFDSMQGSM